MDLHIYWHDQTEHITTQLNRMEKIMSEVSNNQAKLDADVSAETAAVTQLGTELETEVAALKAQLAAGEALDFTALDALVASTQAEAAADAPVEPPV